MFNHSDINIIRLANDERFVLRVAILFVNHLKKNEVEEIFRKIYSIKFSVCNRIGQEFNVIFFIREIIWRFDKLLKYLIDIDIFLVWVCPHFKSIIRSDSVCTLGSIRFSVRICLLIFTIKRLMSRLCIFIHVHFCPHFQRYAFVFNSPTVKRFESHWKQHTQIHVHFTTHNQQYVHKHIRTSTCASHSESLFTFTLAIQFNVFS